MINPVHVRTADAAFRVSVLLMGLFVLVLAGLTGYQLAVCSSQAWQTFGVSFFWSEEWNPVEGLFGALPFIYGTLVSSFLALLIAVPLGIGSAIFLAELAPRRVADFCCFLVELLAAIPSVILGLVGIFVLVPAVRAIEPFLNDTLGFLPIFRGEPYGVGLLSASLILAVMVLPYITSISREVILTVPRSLKEAGYALGATHWEVVRTVVLPCARAGIFGAIFLALGRALGETMAVTMVIGNTPQISASLLEPSYTMAAVIANEFTEATDDLYVHSLIAIGLALFLITIAVNAAARWLIYRTKVQRSAA